MQLLTPNQPASHATDGHPARRLPLSPSTLQLSIPAEHSSHFDDPLANVYDPDAELDLSPDVGQRFDEATSQEVADLFAAPVVQVQRRGITSHPPATASGARDTAWQVEFWAKQTTHKNSVAAKLREIGRTGEASTLEQCHSTWTRATCNDCGAVKRFPNRCDNFYCPECQPRLASERRKAVEWWTHLVDQPKHVVLTVKNVPDLTRGHVQEFKKWFSRLRRSKFARNWEGGFYSLELTNEGRGWHLHLHALIDARWIDEGELSIAWNKVTNGQGRIVKVKDARGQNYLKEVTKYAVKGPQLAAWTGYQIATFIDAFSNVRSFGVFGSLYGARTAFADYLSTLRAHKPKCECGSCNIRYQSEVDAIMADLLPAQLGPSRPAPPTGLQTELAIPLTPVYPH